MAHSRSLSTTEALKDPHLVSLKVLRLSRPTLIEHSALLPPSLEDDSVPSLPNLPLSASLAYPSAPTSDPFQISPLLSLPPGFGRVSVGEKLSCIVCANNELPASSGKNKTAARTLSAFRLSVDVLTPSQQTAVLLADDIDDDDDSGEGEGGNNEAKDVPPGESLERVVHYDLTEEGAHELRVTVKYVETMERERDDENDDEASSERTRSFRKIYKFLSQPCLSVRTKIKPLIAPGTQDAKASGGAGLQQRRYVLEAQLENIGSATIAIESAKMEAKSPFESTSLNWDAHKPYRSNEFAPLINPRQILQVAFMIRHGQADSPEVMTATDNVGAAKDTIVGRIETRWRTTMGDAGQISTHWLTVPAL